MALLIDVSMNIYGIQTSQLYTRIKYVNDEGGTSMEITLYSYFNKNAFEKKSLNRLNVDNSSFPKFIKTDYIRNVDGTDVLLFAHNKVIEKLTTDITREGSIIDSSMGLEKIKTGIVIPKFCDINDITIVDISIN